jgi:ABC-type glutathione transport system ATPase component
MTGGLRVDDLTIRRGHAGPVMIGPVSFAADGGSAIGIVGETGAGKTLVLRALMGLLPTGFEMAGEVRIGPAAPHRDAAALRAELGRQIGVVLQSPFTAFDPLRPVGKQIVEGVLRRRLMRKAAAQDRASSLLRQMGFERPAELQKLFPNQLSGGMAQRVAIAMSVMPSPPRCSRMSRPRRWTPPCASVCSNCCRISSASRARSWSWSATILGSWPNSASSSSCSTAAGSWKAARPAT